MLRRSSQNTFFVVCRVQQRSAKRKTWPADEVQLFVNEYKHQNLNEHMNYLFRKLKYARKGLVAPRANDYDTEQYDDLEATVNKVPEIMNSQQKEKFIQNLLDSYKEQRREQKIAKDDPRSPFYYEDEAKARDAAMEDAMMKALQQHGETIMEEIDDAPQHHGKYKLMSDIRPPKHDQGVYFTSYIPEPDKMEYPKWDPYLIEFPVKNPGDGARKEKPTGFTPPTPRESKIKPDGSVTARGGRKNAIAVATLRKGTGKIEVNGRALVEYFPIISGRDTFLAPFLMTESFFDFDTTVRVRGGGIQGQAGAASYAIAKALEKYDPSYRLVLKRAGLLTRDNRMVERKKPGRPGARKGFQWSRR